MQRFVSNSILETKQIAADIANSSSTEQIYALIGNLGTGKTVFTQGFATALGIAGTVGSPTYKFISEYKGTNNWLYHIDCYRLKSEQQFINIGGEEYLAPENGITLIEWADIILNILPKNVIKIKFERIFNKPNLRRIILNAN